MFYQDWEHYYPGWENWYTNPGYHSHHHHSQAYSHYHPGQAPYVRQSHHHRPRRKYGPYYVPTSMDQYAFTNASSANATGLSDYFYGAAYHHHANSNLG